MQKVGVVQYSQDMEVVGHFASVREAQRAYGISHISAVCRRQRHSDGGYIWRYDNDQHPSDFSKARWEAANPDRLGDDSGRQRRRQYEYTPKTHGGNLVATPKPSQIFSANGGNLSVWQNRSVGEDYFVRIMNNYELLLRTKKRRNI